MECLLGTIHQLMLQRSTNRKDAHPITFFKKRRDKGSKKRDE